MADQAPVKSILASKTFWLNAIGTAIVISNAIPPKYGVPLMGVLNIANRFLTNGPVNFTGA